MLMHLPDSLSDTRALPLDFCWTRFGPEAGESFDHILARKNLEREACDGVFYWGIGSSVAPALRALVAIEEAPEVLFSPISSAPRSVDVSPSHVVRWSTGVGLMGGGVDLPPGACVTSRWSPGRPGAPRYALVCQSHVALVLGDHGELDFSMLQNLCSGAPIGASQVTAVVRRQHEDVHQAAVGRIYRVAMRARLVFPYLVRLSSPAPVRCSGQPGDPPIGVLSPQLSF